MADWGRRRGQIAEDLGVHRASVHRWLCAYQAAGLEGLRIKWAAGLPPRIPEDRATTILAWVKEGGRRAAGSSGRTGPTRSWRRTYTARTASRHARRRCRRSATTTASAPSAMRPRAWSWRDSKEVGRGECALLSRDEARFPLMPTLRATLGIKGHRPRVGTWDNKDQAYCFAALDLVSGRLTTRLLDSPARVKAITGRSKARRLQAAFAGHLRNVARAYPAARHPRVVVVIDNPLAPRRPDPPRSCPGRWCSSAVLGDAVDLEHVLRQIDAKNGHVHDRSPCPDRRLHGSSGGRRPFHKSARRRGCWPS